MKRSELKAFAIQTRRDLLYEVSTRAELFGLEENKLLQIEEKHEQLLVNGLLYSTKMKSSLQSLQSELNYKGFDQLIEEVAYTWFNRMVAIRYMEVNELIPDRLQAMDSLSESTLRQFISAIQVYIDLNEEVLFSFFKNGAIDLLNRKLFLAQCNLLHAIFPASFDKIEDYTELLMPNMLLDQYSCINQFLRSESLTESFSEVEIIGWMHQFYNSEPKDQVFANLKQNKKMETQDIPVATQLFTPKWIVQYMVENTLGKLWINANPVSNLKHSMPYYIKPVEKEVIVHNKQLDYAPVNLKEITFLDPCVGSGHILVYAFDLLYEMYVEAGYEQELIPRLILENNLYGIDIDNRAAQLATFSLIMKACQKSKTILQNDIQINIISIQESKGLDAISVANLLANNENESTELIQLFTSFVNAKQLGSVLRPNQINFDKYINRIKEPELELAIDNYDVCEELDLALQLLTQGKMLASAYDIIVTNPPYIGIRGLSKSTSDYIKKNFPYSKYDMSAVFMERVLHFTKENGIFSMLNQQSWMFLTSYENLRLQLLNESTIMSMLHLGAHTFEDIGGEVVQSTAFVSKRSYINGYKSIYYRLVDYKNTELKREAFLEGKGKYTCIQERFSIIPETPIVYWISKKLTNVFLKGTPLKQIAEPRQGLATADNNRFHRYWYEVRFSDIGFSHDRESALESERKWFPLNKGGPIRKWYGNNEMVVNWQHDGKEIREDKLHKLSIGKCLPSNSKPKNVPYYFREGITWSLISSSKFGVRCYPKGMIFDVGSHAIFCEKEDYYYFASFLNSIVASTLLHTLNPTINYSSGVIGKLPIIQKERNEQIDWLTKENIEIAKQDWDYEETSWDYSQHPFLVYKNERFLSLIFIKWQEIKEKMYASLRENEERLNRIFIELYDLTDELTPEVKEKDITISLAERERDTKSFLSYFIGCLFGRYSLDVQGLAFAGGEWNHSLYHSFQPNKDGIQLLTVEDSFGDDVFTRLRYFLAACFGSAYVEANLLWLAQSLKMKQNETAEERIRRYFLEEFFRDHLKTYHKRPIYWLFNSGKEKGFRALVYMHRIQRDTIVNIENRYVRRLIKKKMDQLKELQEMLANQTCSNKDKKKIQNKVTVLEAQVIELANYREKFDQYHEVALELNLDEGVEANQRLFSNILSNR
ncbi:BREX-1 system adenine-specific DNA-methyltransferase PglX [Halalkalibacter alkaliphilus]|uniref:site-specific DNA-methyltransferase (adenine-specific) n=1 Tax=Halalkalibacter alkaliphilus TaxID=2917993 RepID=A0A9X2CUA0_9BACI|nr:BREX-1 system adenine-specific DNA-methyltransferase PglX [Halalkalibacter alkaliphilus]MCL7748421.1 BREX-1 system adenine-specific DNA-methyltransferase PglX [Halalkalibacter alkaliphilus]